MTNPALSIETTEKIGRLYQLPQGGYDKKISSYVAKRGVEDSTLFPSITNIISVSGGDWSGYAIYKMGEALRKGYSIEDASKAHIEYRDMTSERGSFVHKMIEDYIDSGAATPNARTGKSGWFAPSPNDPDMKTLTDRWDGKGYFDAFLRFCRKYNPEFVTQEATVYGHTRGWDGFNYAGTTDFIARINGKLVVGDWKCTSKFHGSVARQLAAVKNAKSFYSPATGTLQDWMGEDLESAIVVRLCSDGSFEVKTADLDRGWLSFRALRSEWDLTAFGDDYLLEEANL